MDACCETKSEELSILGGKHKNVLKTVLAINALLFLVGMTAGILAQSTALLADSLDMLGDSFVYGFSLYVLWRSAEWKAMAAIVKGVVMALFGIGVLTEAVHKVLTNAVPAAEMMGIVGALALVGNAVCFFALYRYRSDDLNMRSTWLCSRNDIIANTAVLGAAGAVALTGSFWPDLIVGGAIAILFLRTAWTVLEESVREYRGLKMGLISHH
jgi:cation diffusion facilitator family transporter